MARKKKLPERVRRHGSGYRAVVVVLGRRVYSPTFPTSEEAEEWRDSIDKKSLRPGTGPLTLDDSLDLLMADLADSGAAEGTRKFYDRAPDVTAFVSALATNILNGTMTRGQAYTAVIPMIGSGDLKNYAGVPRAAILGKHPCPKDCPQSVTLGELCVSDQIPGNLLFGLILGAKNAWEKARELHAGEDSLEDTDSYQVGESIANEWAKPAVTRGRGPLDRARARAKEITAMGNLIAKKLKERADNNRMRAKVNEFMGGNKIDREHEGILDRPRYVCSKDWPQ